MSKNNPASPNHGELFSTFAIRNNQFEFMIQPASKTARIAYSLIAGVMIILFWRNIGFATALLDMPGSSILGLSIKALLDTVPKSVSGG